MIVHWGGCGAILAFIVYVIALMWSIKIPMAFILWMSNPKPQQRQQSPSDAGSSAVVSTNTLPTVNLNTFKLFCSSTSGKFGWFSIRSINSSAGQCALTRSKINWLGTSGVCGRKVAWSPLARLSTDLALAQEKQSTVLKITHHSTLHGMLSRARENRHPWRSDIHLRDRRGTDGGQTPLVKGG